MPFKPTSYQIIKWRDAAPQERRALLGEMGVALPAEAPGYHGQCLDICSASFEAELAKCDGLTGQDLLDCAAGAAAEVARCFAGCDAMLREEAPSAPEDDPDETPGG